MENILELTNFLLDKFPDVTSIQRRWHFKNNIFTFILCSNCNTNPAIFDKKHNLYKCCSNECSRELIGKKAKISGGSKTRIDKMKESLVKNLGENPYQIIKEKLQVTNLERYGAISQSASVASKIKLIEEKTKNFIDNFLDKSEYDFISRTNDDITLLHKSCNKEFTLNRSTYGTRNRNESLLCTYCQPLYSSSPESEIFNFIKSIYDGEILTNHRKFGEYEIDIYLPEFKLGIEFNGLYFHSEVHKIRTYHRDKRQYFSKLGITILQIWEDLWYDKSDIIKSIIRNKIQIQVYKFQARKLSVREISDYNFVKGFISNNHAQGFTQYTKAFGLYDDEILLSVMTFIKNMEKYELSRFVNLMNTQIIGGANRLFSHFIKTYDPTEIFSYCDLAMFDGGVYSKLGFIKERETIGYFYIQGGRNPIRKNRRLFQKKLLIEKYNADPTKTEKQIANENKWYQLWDAGQAKYIWTKPLI